MIKNWIVHICYFHNTVISRFYAVRFYAVPGFTRFLGENCFLPHFIFGIFFVLRAAVIYQVHEELLPLSLAFVRSVPFRVQSVLQDDQKVQ